MKAHRAYGSSNNWRHKFRVHNAVANIAEYSMLLYTEGGKTRKLCVFRCSCGHQFWGRKQLAQVLERKGQKLVCHQCFVATGQNCSPWYARRLTPQELEKLARWYEAQGVKIIQG